LKTLSPSWFLLTDIRQMAADFSLILRHFGWSRNPEAPMRLSIGVGPGRRPFQSRDVSNFRSSRRTSPVSWSERMTIERLTLSM
jgi:hypothetical protein